MDLIWPFPDDFFILLNSVGGTERGNYNSAFPDLKIDYVR